MLYVSSSYVSLVKAKSCPQKCIIPSRIQFVCKTIYWPYVFKRVKKAMYEKGSPVIRRAMT